MAQPKPKLKVVLPKTAPIDDDDDLMSFPMYDLRNDAGMVVQNDQNQGIIDMLSRLIIVTTNLKAAAKDKVSKANQARRLASFIKARDAISSYPTKIISGSHAKRNIDGVGQGIAERIDEFLITGTLKELVENEDPYTRAVKELCGITGIGEVKAQQLITEYGITSVQQLREAYQQGRITVSKGQLNHHIAVGLEYYDDLKQRMPWSEADAIANIISDNITAMDPELVVNVCGSYRRHSPTCGDIDVLVSHPRDKPDMLKHVVSVLEEIGLLVGHLTHDGKTKYMGVCKLRPNSVGRRIDIRYINYGSLGAALLYFTGSGKFNKIMRFRANERGYTLNEYGLYHYVNGVKGAQIDTPDERNIFKILGFKYLDPTEREFS